MLVPYTSEHALDGLDLALTGHKLLALRCRRKCTGRRKKRGASRGAHSNDAGAGADAEPQRRRHLPIAAPLHDRTGAYLYCFVLTGISCWKSGIKPLSAVVTEMVMQMRNKTACPPPSSHARRFC